MQRTRRTPTRPLTVLVVLVAVLAATAVTIAGPREATARPARSLASGSWEMGFTWSGSAALQMQAVQSKVAFFGNGAGTMSVDADSVSGPYAIVMLASGSGKAQGKSISAEGGSTDTTWSFSGSFGGTATQPCLTGELSLGGTFEYQDETGLVVMPLDGIATPMTCAEWPLRITSVECNVVEGEWAWLKTQGLIGKGYTFTGAPSRFWGVRTPQSATAAAASGEAMRALMTEANAIASAQPISVTDLHAFLQSARTRLPAAASACGARQDDVELQALTRVIVAQMTQQATTLPPTVVIELADFAARVHAFTPPLSDLGRATAESLQELLRKLPLDPAVTGRQLADAADAAHRLGWQAIADRLDQEAAVR